jgi:excinuclease UvrABC helicase subunit UvrB/intein/homing endonuclease
VGVAEFQIVSDFRPTGDQPQAIDALTAGVKRGQKHQTLLGVTGSGKSVVGNTTILVRRGDHVSCEEIGPVVDGLLARRAGDTQHVADTEVLESIALNETTEVFSFDPATGQAAWKSVRQFLRHRSPDSLSKVTTACGRGVTVTGDHNFFVLRDGQLRLLRTDELGPCDYLPLPRQLPEPAQPLLTIALEEQLRAADRVYVRVNDFATAWATHRVALQPILSRPKAHALVHEAERVSLAAYQQMVAVVPSLAAGAAFGTNKRTYSAQGQLPLTPPLLRLLGYYVAEGHAGDRFFILSSAEDAVVSDATQAIGELGLRWHHPQGTYDYRVSSALWSSLLSRWSGRDARSKRLPPFWPRLSNEQLAQVLRAYFTADGGVDGEQVTCVTASQQLASDLGYALLRFGIVGRIRPRLVELPGRTERRGYWQIAISGKEFLTSFRDSIGFALERKKQRLEELLTRGNANTNVDVIPIDGCMLRRLRRGLGMSQSSLAARAGCSRSGVSLIEDGHRRPSRALATALIGALGQEAAARGDNVALQQVQAMASLLRLFWTPVQAVEPAQGERYVYDVAVADNETFLAGRGGLFVHNTFTMANVVQQIQRPTLVMAHNKTLAAQLASEFKEFFPSNAVEYFVSYYDYYQPEAYIPRTDTYIEKDTLVNEDIERLRHSAMQSLLTRRDVLVVASVSCIYGLGDPEEYGQNSVSLRVGEIYKRDKILRRLTDIYYERNDYDLSAGKFRVRGDTLEVHPASQEIVVRVSFWGDELEKITEVDPLTGEVLAERNSVEIYPARYFVTSRQKLEAALKDIYAELEEQVKWFEEQDRLLEAQRLRQRTQYDLEMLEQTGSCAGVENYSRHLSRREPGSTPWTLLDYFPDDFVCFVDESHMTIPQVRGMFNGDRARKEVLVDFGFRLPSALDNRPLMFHEYEQRLGQVLYVSATPGPYELTVSREVQPNGHDSTPVFLIPDWDRRLASPDGLPEADGGSTPGVPVHGAEQLIRPTGLLDPEIEVKPTRGQIDDLMEQIGLRVARGERVLVTTLTKRMAEDLADFLREANVKVHYLHSEVDTLERVEILRDLRLGVYDVVVGINLLREGLDLPEVSLVAILDADKEGYLRSNSSLIQTIGRAARHVDGRVIMYADKVTDSMRRAIDETYRRRAKQQAYNEAHGLTPVGIRKAIRDITERVRAIADTRQELSTARAAGDLPKDELYRLIRDLEAQMKEAARALEFERAALLRDQVIDLRRTLATEEPERIVPREFLRAR